MPRQAVYRATIPNGGSLSEEINIRGADSFVLIVPAAWTAAAITFGTAAESGGTVAPLYDDAGTELTIASAAVVAGRAIALASNALALALATAEFLYIRSGTSAAPVNQAAARTMTLVMG